MGKKIFFLIIILCLAIYLNAEDITIISLNGTVQLKASETANWTPAKIGQKILVNNYIFTGFNSSALLQTGNAKIEVKPLSQAAVSSLLTTNKSIVTDVHLKYGKLKATVDKASDKQVLFKVRSANSTASVRGTIFSLSEEELFVEDGTVYLLNNTINNSLLVQKNESAFIPRYDLLKDPLEVRLNNYFVSTNPVGLSKEERASVRGINLGRTGISSGKAEVIITITIID